MSRELEVFELIYRVVTIQDIICGVCEKSCTERIRDDSTFARRLYKLGWRVIDGRVLCPECAKKGKGDENRSA
jgi:hypothetical protein